MAIQTDEIKWYRPTVINDTSANGGPVSDNEVPDGVKNNVWPNVPSHERESGSVKYRKSFIKVDNEEGLHLLDPKIFIESPTPGDDRVVLIPATETNTQGDITGEERMYGAGHSLDPILDGAKGAWVQVEHAPDNVFMAGDLVRLSDQNDVDDVNGQSYFVRLDHVLPGPGRDTVLLVFEEEVFIGTDCVMQDAKVSSVYEPADGNLFAMWERRTVPACSRSLAGNRVVIAISGESE